MAVELGDRRWRTLQARHHAVVRRQLRPHHGREVDTAGDGFFATFARPADAARCAVAIIEAVRALGLEARAGVHIGEAELGGEKVSGIAVTTAARVAAAAVAGQVLATDTIVHLTAGSGLEFSDAVTYELKGVPGAWNLSSLAAIDGRPLGAPLDPDDARRVRDSSTRTTPRGAKSRTAIAVAVTLAVAVVAAVVVQGDGHDTTGGLPTSAPAQAGLVALRDATGDQAFPVDIAPPRTGILTGQIAFTGAPGSASSFGWLPYGFPLYRLRVAQVNRATGAVVGVGISFDTDRSTCVCVAAADGRLWTPVVTGKVVSAGLADTHGLSLRGIDLGGGPRRDIPVDPDLDSGGILALVAGAGYFWMGDTTDERVYRIDPGTSSITKFGVGQGADLLTFGDGALWVLDTLEGRITRVDPATGTSGASLAIPGDLKGIAVGGGYLWAVDATGKALQRIPEDLESAATAISLGGFGTRPKVVAYDGGAIVVGFEGGTVAKINPSNPTTPTVLWTKQVGNDVSSLTLDRGVVWVAGARLPD